MYYSLTGTFVRAPRDKFPYVGVFLADRARVADLLAKCATSSCIIGEDRFVVTVSPLLALATAGAKPAGR